jgi:hypothetical protein
MTDTMEQVTEDVLDRFQSERLDCRRAEELELTK